MVGVKTNFQYYSNSSTTRWTDTLLLALPSETTVPSDITNSVPPELAESIANELDIAISYKARFQQSKAAISVARNCSSTIVPITALPTEILTRIFRLVVGSQRCHAAGERIDRKNITFPAHPVRLSHVCSRWRQVALDAPGLWTHIDFPPFPRDQQLMTRMDVYMGRSRQSLLDVHVVEEYPSNPSSNVNPIYTHLIEFLQPIFTRTRSLHIELDFNDRLFGIIGSPAPSLSFCSALLSYCLAGCVSGTLTQLDVRVEGVSNVRGLMESIDNPENNRSVILALPKQALEDLLFRIPILRLNGPIPPLSSGAYHGLVELRLGPFVRASISELQLVAMLKSSPGLRILEFGMARTHQLRTLQIDRIRGFFARSNVTRLHGLIFDGYPQVAELLTLAPRMRDLDLEEFRDRSQDGGVEALDNLAPNISLNSLTLRRCLQLEMDELGRFLERLQVRVLILQYCSFRGSGRSMIEQDVLRNELSALCPIVQFLPNEPEPVNKWCWLD
ncbi:F-box-like domain-containing protein [Ceratobasidium theobromae]|uniref:F-box-like domain-containing protein n=1 Tax=Ceratobasidium theobromae TaxID=1582974 RepID=A0A5N5QQ60_9AGAM|nr:F-box-like domain-containing protein [Ceratobasidium theobromae]